jgi:hypothetical protein
LFFDEAHFSYVIWDTKDFSRLSLSLYKKGT